MKLSLSSAITLAALLGFASAEAQLRGSLSNERALQADEVDLKTFSAMLKIPYQGGHMIGHGVNAVTGEQRHAYFDYDETVESPNFSAWVDYMSTSSSQEVKDTTEKMISAEAGAWGFSVSGSLKWMTSEGSSVESLSLIAATSVKSYILSIKPRSIHNVDSRMLADLQQMKDEGRLKDFAAKYGTHYISGIQYGGSAFSKLSIKTTSRSSKEEIEKELTAKYKSISFQGSAGFKESLKKATGSHSLEIKGTSYVEGTGMPALNGTDIDEVIKAIGQFGKQIENLDRPPHPMFLYLDEWEGIKEIRDILGDERIVPKIQSATSDAISGALTSLKYSVSLVNSLGKPTNPPPPAYNGNPAWIIDTFQKQVSGWGQKSFADLERIEKLTIYDLAKLNPTTPEFEEEYLQAHIYEQGMNKLANGLLRSEWTFNIPPEHSSKFIYDGPPSGEWDVNVTGTGLWMGGEIRDRLTDFDGRHPAEFACVGNFDSHYRNFFKVLAKDSNGGYWEGNPVNKRGVKSSTSFHGATFTQMLL